MLMDVRRVVAALVLAGLLVGCSDDGPSSGPPEASDSASVSDPPTPSAEARDATAAGARAFVRYWIESFNYAMQTGETAEFRLLFTRSCDSCSGIVQLIDDIYEPGGHVQSDGWLVKRFSGTSMRSDSEAAVHVQVILSAQVIQRAGEKNPDRRAGGQGSATFFLTRDHSGWRVANVLRGTN
jgi:hypothetical protein